MIPAMTSRRVWVTSLLATVLVAGSCGADKGPASPRPGFALGGSIETEHFIHLYRATLPPSSGRGIVIQFHPRDGSAFRLQDDAPLPVDALVICAHGVGIGATRIAGSCRTVKAGREFRIEDQAGDHIAVELLAPGDEDLFVPEFVVGYEPVDAFLGIEFPAPS